jgi:hypothetical protein
MIRTRHIGAFTAALLLAGCAGVDLVQAGKPADLGDGISVVPGTAWARVHTPGTDPIFTIDGIGLGELHAYTGIDPGKPIFSVSGVSDKDLAAYTKGMLPNEVMDLLVGNMSKSGAQNVHASNLAPAKFGSGNGFRFDIAYVNANGLDMQGEALIAERTGKLDVLLFVAPQEYYFARRKPDVEQLFATIQAG